MGDLFLGNARFRELFPSVVDVSGVWWRSVLFFFFSRAVEARMGGFDMAFIGADGCSERGNN